MKSIFLISLFFILLGCQSKTNHLSIEAESKLIQDSLYSKSLQEYRYFNIYLPPNYSNKKSYPVIYFADGQMLSDSRYKKGFDSLFKNDSIKKSVVFGINSNSKLVDKDNPVSYRHFEYISFYKGIKDDNDDRLEHWYTNHMTFFTQEAISFAEKKYGVSKDRKDRIFYGASNGGGFGITLGIEYPKLYKTIICHSPTEVYREINWDTSQYEPPFFFLAYGDTNDFYKPSLTLDSLLTANNYKHELNVYKGEHDSDIWRQLMFETLEEILSLKK